MNENEIKEKLLTEFSGWFCDAYCQYFGLDDFCKCCPIKDANCWLKQEEAKERIKAAEEEFKRILENAK